MGTSTVHRSPSTPRWTIVNNLYENPEAESERLLAEVFNASADRYPEGLADLPVIERVEALLDAARSRDWRGGREDALDAARDAVREAQTAALATGVASFYGDLADRALHITLAGVARDPDRLSTPGTTLTAFLDNLVTVSIGHVVARDLGAHIGGRGVATAAEALALQRRLADQARGVVSDQRLAEVLGAAAASPRREWANVIARVWELGAALPDQVDRSGAV